MKYKLLKLALVFSLAIGFSGVSAATSQCELGNIQLEAEDQSISYGQFTEAKFQVTNVGTDSTDVNVNVYTDDDSAGMFERSLSPGRTLERDVSVSAGDDRNRDGEVEVRAEFEAECGYTETRTTTVQVEENLEQPVAAFDYSPRYPEVGEEIRFNSLSFFNNNEIERHRYNFRDGTVTEEENPSHTYSQSGHYNVILRVWDTQGNHDVKSNYIRVFEQGQSPGNGDNGDENEDNLQRQQFLVTDGSDNPLDDVLIEVNGNQIRTGADGRANIELEKGRQYTAEISKSGYISTSRSFNPSDTEISVALDVESNPEARLSVSPNPARVGTQIMFDARESVGAVRYYFDFDSNGVVDEINTDGVAYRQFSSEGQRTATVTIEDEFGFEDSATREFEVTQDRGRCDIRGGFLWRDSRTIDQGDSTEVRITAYNNGDPQDVRATFKVDGVTVSESFQEDVQTQHTFRADVSPEEDARVTATLDAIGDPCGDSQIVERSTQISVNPVREKARLNVNVEDSEGNPISDARVTAGERLGSTDSNGRVGFDLDSGRYTVRASKDRYSSQSRTITLDEGETRNLNLQISRTDRDGQVRIITEEPDGDRVRDVEVNIRNGDDRDGFTGSNGVYETSLAPGSYDVTGSKSGYRVAQSSFDLNAGEERTETLTMRPRDVSPPTQSTLGVHVETVGGMDLRDAEVTVRGPVTRTRTTNSRGDTEFSIPSGEYTVEVSREGYESRSRTIQIDPGETRNLEFRLSRTDRDEGKSTLDVHVRDTGGAPIEDARVTAENSDMRTEFTGSSGSARMRLDSDTYTVRASKSGYTSSSRTVFLGQNDRRSITLTLDRRDRDRSMSIDRVSTGERTVCRGDDLDVTVTSTNGNQPQNLRLEANIGGSTDSTSFGVRRGETVTRTLTLGNVRGDGEEQLEVELSNGETVRATEEIFVSDCTGQRPPENGEEPPEDDDLRISIRAQPQEITLGESVRLSGYVDGVTNPRNVELLLGGEKVADVRTDGSGYYSTYVQPQDVGQLEARARSGGQSAITNINVIPHVRVTSIDAPDRTFEDRGFEVCGNVESPVDARVTLERDGESIQTQYDRGNVCFELFEERLGDHDYTIRAFAGGNEDSRTTTVDVREAGQEARTFPDRLATVRSGEGLVRVSLYNTHDTSRTYNVALSNFPDDWFAQSRKEVTVQKGERRNVYFYVTPKAEGEFDSLVTVESDGDTVHTENVRVRVGGTTKKKSWFSRMVDNLRWRVRG